MRLKFDAYAPQIGCIFAMPAFKFIKFKVNLLNSSSFINDNIDFKRNCAPRESVQHGLQTRRVFKTQDVSTMMEKS